MIDEPKNYQNKEMDFGISRPGLLKKNRSMIIQTVMDLKVTVSGKTHLMIPISSIGG